MTATPTALVGAGIDRVDAVAKVTGAARYAVEHPVDGLAHAVVVTATVAAGRVRAVDATAALAVSGVLEVVHHANAPELGEAEDRELLVFQSDEVAYRGQIVAAVVAESLELARHAARLVRVEYDEHPHDVGLRADRPDLYAPEQVNAGLETDTAKGDVEAALDSASVRVGATYTTPAYHNNPMETHSSLAVWDGDDLTVYDSSQGTTPVAETLSQLFSLPTGHVRVVAQHVGGGFGSKGRPHPHVVVAVVAARMTGRPVELTVTRQQMFVFTGYRTPTIQHIQLGAGADGRLTAIAHDVVEQTSFVGEFAEQTASPTRVMYAGANRRTTHRLARLNVPTPSWMRAPGECPGMFALESAMDELAVAAGIDPIELRVRNEPDREPESDLPFSSRNLIGSLREGARRFGWEGRDPTPRARRDGRWWVGTGVAASVYPAIIRPASATAGALGDGRWHVRVNATDIGTGARTVLTQLAAEELGVGVDGVVLDIGDSRLPKAYVAGGSSGTASWGTAVVRACHASRLAGGAEATVDTTEEAGGRPEQAYYAFGAQFAEARVDVDSGEVRVPRLVGVFAAGRIVNPKTARSQLLGGMTMGLSMALAEESVMDPQFGDYVNHDFAQYHVATNADVVSIDVSWLDEEDDRVNPIGVKGIGEIGIVGTAAAVANAVWHATGVRVRDLPIRLDRFFS